MNPFYRPIVAALVAAALVVAFSAFSNDKGGLASQRRQKAEIAEYEQRNQALERENQALAQEIESLSGNPKVLERSARETLGLVRSDEVIFNFEK